MTRWKHPQLAQACLRWGITDGHQVQSATWSLDAPQFATITGSPSSGSRQGKNAPVMPQAERVPVKQNNRGNA